MSYKYTIPQNTINWRPEQHFQRIDKYSLYLWDEKRIETWEEVVTRSVNVLRHLSKNFYSDNEYQRMFDLIYNLEVSPSMRLLSMPLKAIQRCNTVLYNCTAGICDTPKIFAEAQYLSMSGCGVAWSVEKIHINKLPTIPQINLNTNFTHIIEDSQVGWAISTNLLINTLYTGSNINFDYSLIRHNGSPLKTKGGYASGPQPLIDYHNFIRDTFVKAQGRKLTSLEVHDLMCYALESGISGATRRSAGLCLFDQDDELMANCKYNGFWNHPTDKVRANANNSIVMNGELSKEDINQLTYPWFNGLGEPGLIKRDNLINNSPKRREFIHPEAIGVNPCAEIILQPIPVDSKIIPGGGWQFCNLSTVNVRPYDTLDTLLEKTKYATIIGDIQSLATNFQFIRSGTKTICDKDRLLGVNLSNYALAPIIRSDEIMEQLRLYVNEIDEQFSKDFNVPISAAQTASKPSGNSSVLCYMGPGSNLVHSKYQKRNMTINKNSAMHNFLLAQGVERHDYPGRDYASLFTFLIDYPDTALTLDSATALDQLEIWKQYKLYWCEHNPSCSITYKPHEVELIKEWLYENQNIIAGLAFFPEFHAYELAPIVPITENEFQESAKLFPVINWDNYSMYETGHDDRQLTVDCASGECVIHY